MPFRGHEPEDITGAILFLTSDDGRLYHRTGNRRGRRSVSDRLTRFASCPEPKLHGCTEDTFLHWKCVPCVVRLREEVLVLPGGICGQVCAVELKMPIAGSGCSGSTVARAGAICRHDRNDPIVREVDEIVQIA